MTINTLEKQAVTETRENVNRIKGDNHHNIALDGLRFIAFLAVYISHTLDGMPKLQNISDIIDLGDLGVETFFVLSGFLIGKILIDARDEKYTTLKEKLRIFYIRRSLRIFPAYYLVLAMVAVFPLFGWLVMDSREILPWELLYATNIKVYLAHRWPGSQSHLWSLAVEEQFYLLAPLIVLMFNKKKLPWLFVFSWIACAVGRYIAYKNASTYACVLAPMQFDCMTLGIAAAILNKQKEFLVVSRCSFNKFGLICSIIAIPILLLTVTSVESLNVFSIIFGKWIFCAGIAYIVLRLWDGDGGVMQKALSFRPIVYLGQISYGLYLYHNFCLDYFQADLLDKLPIIGAIIGFIVTIVISSISWHLFEKPINDLKRHFPYRKANEA